MKLLSVIGARPQFIKEAVIQKKLRDHSHVIQTVVHTGQHYDQNMSGVFFDTLNMQKPEYNLGIRASRHGEMTGKMIVELENIMKSEKPDVVLLYGDTNSTLAGAIAASKLKLRVAHVEAGLRQKPKDIPEEINRVLTDRISDFLFAPSKLAVQNLKGEGITDGVHFTGDVMYDLFLKMRPKFDYSLVEKLKLKPNEYIMATLHRDFNVDRSEKLKKILGELNRVAKDIKVVFPMHPRTKKRIREFGLEHLLKNIVILDPIDYLQLMGLTENCFKVFTDSGGYQKEAYFSEKEAVVLMPDTCWRELIVLGLNRLVNENEIYQELTTQRITKKMDNIYGDGKASKRIMDILINGDVRKSVDDPFS